MEVLQGKDSILLFRIDGEATDAWKLAFQTEHNWDESRDYESTETKDGAVKTAGAYTSEISMTALYEQGSQKIKDIRHALREGEVIHVWEVETFDLESATIGGEYAEGNITTLGKASPSEGNVELTMDLSTTKPISGEVTVTPTLLEIIARADDQREFVQPTEDTGI